MPANNFENLPLNPETHESLHNSRNVAGGNIHIDSSGRMLPQLINMLRQEFRERERLIIENHEKELLIQKQSIEIESLKREIKTRKKNQSKKPSNKSRQRSP